MLEILKETFFKTCKDFKEMLIDKKFYLILLFGIVMFLVLSLLTLLTLFILNNVENRFLAGLFSSLSFSAGAIWVIFAINNLTNIISKKNGKDQKEW